MSEVQCLKVRIRSGMTDRVVQFLDELGGREEEVQASLQREGIRAEALFLDRGGEADHLIFITWAEDLEAANRAFAESTAPLDRDTRAWIEETWGEARPLEILAHLVRDEEA